MIENKLTPDLELQQKFAKFGVVVFVRDLEGKVLVLRENESKSVTGKNAGEYSVLCETGEVGESWGETVVRGIEEELGVLENDQQRFFGFEKECYLGETVFVEGVLARVATVYFTGPTEKFTSGLNLGEVTIEGWKSLEQLAGYPLRRGVQKVLKEVLDQNLLDKPNAESELWPLSLGYLRINNLI